MKDVEIAILLPWLSSGAVSGTIAEILKLALYTGARTGEVCAMRWQDVDLVSATWTHVQTKTGDASITPLSQPAVDILQGRAAAQAAKPTTKIRKVTMVSITVCSIKNDLTSD